MACQDREKKGANETLPLVLVVEFQAAVDPLSPEVRAVEEDRWTCRASRGVEPGVGRDLRAAQTHINLIPRTDDRTAIQERVADGGPHVAVDPAADVDPEFGDHCKHVTGKLTAVAPCRQEPDRSYCRRPEWRGDRRRAVNVNDLVGRAQSDLAKKINEHPPPVKLRLGADLAAVSMDLDGTIRTWNRGAVRLYGYSSDEAVGRSVKVLVPEDRTDEWTQVMALLALGEHVEQLETEHVRKDERRIAVALTVSPIRDSVGKIVSASVTGRDISRRKELELEVVEIASLEQRRIAQDLHDSVSQELTALSMLAGNLAQTLQSDASHAPSLVERMILGLQRSQQELRAVMHGLHPVSVDAEGLMAALSDLANRTRQEGKVTCSFDCLKPVLVEDNLVATHLYLIAQEAVHNAVKHARCQNIRISVASDHLLVLRVQDDGIGIPDQPIDNHGGLGLRIMRNRAAIIRATLTIDKALPAGTVVTCALARKNHET